MRFVGENGTATWTGGSVTMLGGSVFQNSAGATFDAQSDSSFVYFSGAAPAFNNAGTFAKSSGAGTTSFSAGVDFNNSGSVAVQTGTLGLFGGGTSTGSFVVSSGAGLTFAGDHDLQAGSSITGAGVVSFTGSSALGSNVIGGTYNVADTQITGGRNDFNADVTTGTATLSGNTAVLQGSGQFTATGVFTWSGATMSGSGVTRAQGGLTINGDAVKTLGRTLENSGSATWTGTGNVEMLDGGVFVNATSGTFAAQNDAGFVLAAGATAAEFRNGGAFTKIGGLGTTSFGDGVAFTNSGTVTAVSGTLSFQGGYTQTAGSLVLNGGSVFASTPLDIDGGSVAGSGTMNAAILNGGNISPGLADSAGNLIVNGEVTFEAASRLTIEIGGRLPGLQYDRLTSSGATALAGFLDVSFIDGFEQGAGGVAALDSFTILDGTTLIGSFSNAPNGSRVATSDGLGSFVVSYSGNDVVLSQFQAVPEPSTIAMLVVGGMTGFILYCRRRQ